jgi:hypothetical protein
MRYHHAGTSPVVEGSFGCASRVENGLSLVMSRITVIMELRCSRAVQEISDANVAIARAKVFNAYVVGM